MGCSYSKLSFSPNDKFVGQNKVCYNILLDLGLSSEDIDIFYIAFSDIDANSSGFVRIDELTSYFKIPENPFTSYVFEIFDFKKVHELNFIQFCFSIWNFLSSFDIALFCFKIADKALELTISVNELKYVLEVIHNCKLEKSFLYPLYKSFVGTLKDSLTVKLQSFLDWCEKNSAIIGPVYVLQKLFRARILGESYWVKTAVNRTNNPNTSDYKYTLPVIEQLKKIDNDHNADLEKNEFYNKSKKPDRNKKGQRTTMLLNFYQLQNKPSNAKNNTSDMKINTPTGNVQQKRARKSFLKPSLAQKSNKVTPSK